MHLVNGAVFGAVYANVAAAAAAAVVGARARSSALTEHVATWPLTLARRPRAPRARRPAARWPAAARAFAQATWRHLLFGVVLGELERRLNAAADPEIPAYEHVVSSNGHGTFEAAVSAR